MLFTMLGLALGLLLAFADVPLLTPLLDMTVAGVSTLASGLVGVLAGLLPGMKGRWLSVPAALIGGLAPALACMSAAAAARAAKLLRAVVGAMLLLAGLAAFAFLPAGQAFVVAGLCGTFAALIALASGAALVAPLAALTVILGVRTVRSTLSGHDSLLPWAGELSELLGGQVSLWAALLAAATLILSAMALVMLVRD
jgi:hypothetical protein